MSSARIWSHKCGKVSYFSRKDALAKNEEREAETNSQWRGTIYLCKTCQHWHRATKLSNAQKRDKARKRARNAAVAKSEKEKRIALAKKYEGAKQKKERQAYVEASRVRRQIAHLDRLEGVAPSKKKRKKKRNRASAHPRTEVAWASSEQQAPVTQRIQLPQSLVDSTSQRE